MARKKRPKIHESSDVIVWARFWRLVVTWFWKDNHNLTTVICKCDCWKDVITRRYSLTHWQESCSCKQYEDNKIRAYKHGMWWTWKWWRNNRFYNIYSNIRSRTSWRPLRERDKCYEWVKCLWNSFEDFKNDMYESYVNHVNEFWEKNTTIDRIDPDKDYCKENCRWATIKEQANNKKIKFSINVDWKIFTSTDIMKKYWVSRHTALKRMRKYLENTN